MSLQQNGTMWKVGKRCRIVLRPVFQVKLNFKRPNKTLLSTVTVVVIGLDPGSGQNCVGVLGHRKLTQIESNPARSCNRRSRMLVWMREVGDCAAQPASARRSAITYHETFLHVDASICNVQRNHVLRADASMSTKHAETFLFSQHSLWTGLQAQR